MEAFVVLVVVWLVLCGVNAWLAQERGRGAFAYLVLSVLLSPVVGYCMLIALTDLEATARAERHAERMTAQLVEAMQKQPAS